MFCYYTHMFIPFEPSKIVIHRTLQQGALQEVNLCSGEALGFLDVPLRSLICKPW